MSDVKRYDCYGKDALGYDYPALSREAIDGDWVLVEDHIAECDALKARLAACEELIDISNADNKRLRGDFDNRHWRALRAEARLAEVEQDAALDREIAQRNRDAVHELTERLEEAERLLAIERGCGECWKGKPCGIDCHMRDVRATDSAPPVMHGCICPIPAKLPDGSNDWKIDPSCQYHKQAAERPWDHRIPWNCPTFHDGCNCAETIKELRAAVTVDEVQK